MKSLIIRTPHHYYSGDKIEKNFRGGACSGYGGYMVLVGNLTERDHLENPYAGRRIILRWIFRKWDVGYGLDRAG
jgi:hypothetical protein